MEEMKMTKFEKYVEDLEIYCQEFGCNKREGLIDILLMLPEGVAWMDQLEKELDSMSDEKLMEVYINF